jgi:hypothetical protein
MVEETMVNIKKLDNDECSQGSNPDYVNQK